MSSEAPLLSLHNEPENVANKDPEVTETVAEKIIGAESDLPIVNLGPLAISEEEKNASLLYKINEAQRRQGRHVDPEAAKEQIHRFWSTHPLPPFSDYVVRSECINTNLSESLANEEQLAFKNSNGVSNYYWCDFELAEFAELYSTDTEKYTVHTPLTTMQAWAEGYKIHRVGIRRTSNNKLVGAIIGREIISIIQGDAQPIIEMGYMYVESIYRKRHMAEYLIKEFRRVSLNDTIKSALFSINFILPTPASTWSSCIRELQPEKLTALIPVDEKESIDEKARALELRPEFMATGLRRATFLDAESIAEFLEGIDSYDVWQQWTVAQIESLIRNGTCWVIEKFENGCGINIITDFVAWVDQEWHPRAPWNATLPVIKVAQVVLQAFGCDSDVAISCTITDLMKHALADGYHIFQTEKIGDTEMYASNLRFVEWGYPRYLNTYNYRMPSMGCKQIGYPIGWNV